MVRLGGYLPGCTGKTRYTLAEAKLQLTKRRRDRSKRRPHKGTFYLCSYCKAYHVSQFSFGYKAKMDRRKYPKPELPDDMLEVDV